MNLADQSPNHFSILLHGEACEVVGTASTSTSTDDDTGLVALVFDFGSAKSQLCRWCLLGRGWSRPPAWRSAQSQTADWALVPASTSFAQTEELDVSWEEVKNEMKQTLRWNRDVTKNDKQM